MDTLTIEQMMERFPGTTRGSWAQMRYQGKGPKFMKVGRRVYYPAHEVEAWVKEQTRTVTGSAA
ncbi:helix-turn-helix transcriptional regulator [Kocuria marina]|uniref:helix-turn-helix transcriptional regulator n=1 Tax=Kocuria marina TaxID=223184 RepID=UPI0022E27FA9|nr:helix-turn-helix domain-containing protein [Kocuria marina]